MTDVNDLHEVNDRGPGEPEQAPPLDLDNLQKLYDLAEEPGGLPAWGRVVYLEVPGLIAELRAARERIAEFEALPTREEWAATRDREAPPHLAEGDVWYGDSADEAAVVAKRHGMHLWRQKLAVHHWEPIGSEPPF